MLERVSEQMTPSSVQESYVTFPARSELPNETVAELIANYDPNHEILLMYREHSGSSRTLRVLTAPGARHPRRVWFFEVVRILEEEPEAAPEHIPPWFWEFWDGLERLDTGRKDNA